MLFLSDWFWAFSALVVPLYVLVPRPLKLYWILAASLIFQLHFAGSAGTLPIIALAVVAYGAALVPRGRGLTAAAMLVMVGALVFYKYAGFLLDSGHAVLASLGAAAPGWLHGGESPAVPLGISFFTFEFVHYVYEVRVRGLAPVRNPLHFAVFAAFFATLAAGPIKRFPDFVPQLAALANPDPEQWLAGARRIILGLFKKVCIADLIVELIKPLDGVVEPNARVVLTLAVLQGWRIYYDFSGYTDIAVGIARMLGLRVPENFDRPYFATSLREFWRRWHMSLSTWIRDYVYIPLGGNRVRRGINLLLAMVICGLWHGAAWNFALWGLWHGVGLAGEAAVRRRRPDLFERSSAERWLGWAVTYTYVSLGWLLFFYPVERLPTLAAALVGMG
ncbi:MAG TPA: MBOAT family O-acyltransferase [Candidatus Dormibacteraeota bacterium]|nr:MBOAT family O-acyltransferase [Candidatus Dormibacteraeota bacterium]